MNSEIIKNLFTLMTENIFPIIYIFAAIEVYLVITIFILLRKHDKTLIDATDNLLKGFEDAPDKDFQLHAHEKIQNSLQFISHKLKSTPEIKQKLWNNAQKITERPNYNKHYKIEIFASIMSTLVQVFPLLGILGTILAIAQTTLTAEGAINASALSKAFVLAMDTTILGLVFSILFMVIESTFQPKIERVIQESNDYREIVSSVLLNN
jgi:biopolymer transport protein ExbB/TolQ